MATINSANTIFTPASTGSNLQPSQPAFFANNNALATDVTGDGTVYTLVFPTVVFNQRSVFDGTSTFTAPTTGKYYIRANIYIEGITAGMTLGVANFVTTPATIAFYTGSIATYRDATNNQASINGALIINLTSGDTVTVTLTISNGTKVADVRGSGIATNFSGFLMV